MVCRVPASLHTPDMHQKYVGGAWWSRTGDPTSFALAPPRYIVGTRIDWGVDIGLRLPLLCFAIGMPAVGFHIQSVPGETAENLRWRHVHEVAPVAATCKF